MAGRNRNITGASNIRITINGQEINVNSGEGFNTNQQDDDKSPKKCPQCGDTLEEGKKICPSCDYIFDEDSLNDSMMELEDLMVKLRNYKPGFGVNRPNLLTSINYQIITIRSGYGSKAQVREKLEKYETEKEVLVKKQNKDSLHLKLGCTSILVIVGAIILFIANNSNSVPTPQEKIEKLIKEGNVGKAKTFLPLLDSPYSYERTLNKMEIDSLVEAKNYDDAMQITKRLVVDERLEARKKIVPLQVNELIETKKFDEARDKANALGNISFRDSLSKIIDLAEKQTNEEAAKKAGKTNKSRRRTRKHA